MIPTLQLGQLGRGGSAAAAEPDPYFSSVTLLLHFNGANGGTTTTDSSSSPKTITLGADARISTAQSKFGGSSGFVNPSGGSLSSFIAAADAPGLNMGDSVDWTIETWIYWVQLPSVQGRLCWLSSKDAQSGSFYPGTTLGVDTSNAIFMEIGSGNSSPTGYQIVGAAPQTAFVAGAWTHCFASRVGLSLYVGSSGKIDATATKTGTIGSGSVRGLHIGREANSAGITTPNCYFEEFRVTKGVGRYSGSVGASYAIPASQFADS